MNPEELTNLIRYHTRLHEDAVTEGNVMLAAHHSAMAAAFQAARGEWTDPSAKKGPSKKKPDPRIAQLEGQMKELVELLAELKGDAE